jgi:hypothetical protein
MIEFLFFEEKPLYSIIAETLERGTLRRVEKV